MKKRQIFMAIIVIVLIIGGFLISQIRKPTLRRQKTIKEVKEELASKLINIDGVVGIGIGKCNEGNLCIKVFLIKDCSSLKKQIPEQVDGFKVETEVTGPIEIF